MKQIVIPKHGGPEVLRIRELPDPEPGPGEVRIRVRASGLNFADILARMGLYPDAPRLPAVVGYEVAGDLDKVGPGVTDLAPGTRVLALTKFGGHSDVVVVPAAQVHPIPDSLGYNEAAAIPVNYLTAWLMLIWLGNLHQGERVLVHAAAGGVGQAAIQICRWRGAEVIGTASAAKHQRLREEGVAYCIDYNTQDFETEVLNWTRSEGVDIALDAVGGASFAKSYRCLAHMGRLFVFGVSSFATGRKLNVFSAVAGLLRMPSFKPIPMMNANRGVFGVNLGHLWHKVDRLAQMMADILKLVEEGKLHPVVDKTFPFDKAAEAHQFIQSRRNFGKIILTP